MLIQYIRDQYGKKYGVAVADAFVNEAGEKEVRFGYSICHRGLDTFDKDRGLNIAKERMKYPDRPCMQRLIRGTGKVLPDEVQEPISEAMNKLKERAVKYFKDAKCST